MKSGFKSIILLLALFSLLFILSCSSSTKPNKVADPIFTPPGGLYTQSQQLSITCATEGAEIRYTLDGSTPPVNSIVYTAPFDVPLGTTVKAIATKAGKDDSKVITAFYSGIVPTPEISPESGIFFPWTPISISIDGQIYAYGWPDGINVRYTLDGTEPDTTSLLYEEPFTRDESCTLKARAYCYNWIPSVVVSAAYLLCPEFEVIGSCDTPGVSQDVTVSGNFAYLADGIAGLQIINISEPALPYIEGSTVLLTSNATHIAVWGNYAFLTDPISGLLICDVSNPTAPNLVGYPYLFENFYGVRIAGNYAYVLFTIQYSYAKLGVINISNPTQLNMLGYCTLPDPGANLCVSGNYAYVACNSSGLRIFDISDPANINIVGSCDTPGSALGVSVSGDYAYIADEVYGLQVINISNPAAPYIVGNLATPHPASNVTFAGNYAYVCLDFYYLLKVDVTNPAAPVISAFCKTPSLVSEVVVEGNYIYAAGFNNGLLVIEQ